MSMTEDVWRESTSFHKMVSVLLQPSVRKSRLWAVASMRKVLRSRIGLNFSFVEALDLAERCADNNIGTLLTTARTQIGVELLSTRNWRQDEFPSHVTATAVVGIAIRDTLESDQVDLQRFVLHLRYALRSLYPEGRWMIEEEYPSKMLRCVFGNPFRSAEFCPSWRTQTALELAKQMYTMRDFRMMPILGDALQDTGCDNEEAIVHCMKPGQHTRGCWVVDCVLGKE